MKIEIKKCISLFLITALLSSCADDAGKESSLPSIDTEAMGEKTRPSFWLDLATGECYRFSDELFAINYIIPTEEHHIIIYSDDEVEIYLDGDYMGVIAVL